ncbi:N-acetyltransferase [Diplocarpon rosae]|nr:N-acetyltransferase [Diplocarpon rosae]
MKDEQIQAETASEPLSLPEEYKMQQSWRTDHDKLTFIACVPLPSLTTVLEPGISDSPTQMLGDVNLFLTPSDEDDEGVIGELELMIAPTSQRRKGYGRATVLAFMQYITSNLASILSEYGMGQTPRIDKPKLLQLKVKIGSKNVKSIRLFEGIGFLKVGEGPNYFGEVELVFEGFLGDSRLEGLRRKYKVENYQEIRYGEEENGDR